jgi:2-polyprenyl-3-methyl-5-hydroxy-6-metoxy-1,4-benzoquinol methylase
MRNPVTNEYIPQSWETVNCPVCSSSSFSEYEKFGSQLQYTYVKCKNCSLIYTNPRPTYNQDFIDCCYESYYQYAKNLSITELNSIPHSSFQMFNEEIDYISKYDKHKQAVLDIGSGMGTFLLAAKKYYSKLIGLDVSIQMANFIEKNIGIKVYVQQFHEFEHESFSLIHMSHVIEHIPNPNEWVAHANKLLINDGILVINVPNKFSLGSLIQHLFYVLKFKKQVSSSWNDATRTPDHLYEPTIKSFKLLLSNCNFEIIEYYTYSRKDPTSSKNIISKFMNRFLHLGSNITFILRKNS